MPFLYIICARFLWLTTHLSRGSFLNLRAGSVPLYFPLTHPSRIYQPSIELLQWIPPTAGILQEQLCARQQREKSPGTMDFQSQQSSIPLHLWSNANFFEQQSAKNTTTPDVSIAQLPPIQGPPTVTQNQFDSNLVDQYLLSSSLASEGLFPTQGTEFSDSLQYLSLSASEPFPTLSDFTTSHYGLDGTITTGESPFALSGFHRPLDPIHTTVGQEHQAMYVVPASLLLKPSTSDQPTLTGWPGGDSAGVTPAHVSPPQTSIQQGIAPALLGHVSPTPERILNHVSPPDPPIPQLTVEMVDAHYTQAVGKKRKSPSENGVNERSVNTRLLSPGLGREALGLRSLRGGTATKYELGKWGKRRELDSPLFSSPLRDEKDFDPSDSGGSDEGSTGNFDDQSYHPSPISSPSDDQSSPFSHNASSGINSPLRGSSKTSSNGKAVSPPVSPPVGEQNNGGTTGSRKKGKGKAKGSAALALARLTMKNNMPPTGPFGTFVPFPPELASGSGATYGDGIGVRSGRKRRNGHIPPPVPDPNLVKRSRGRKVPTNLTQEQGKARPFRCDVGNCGASFTRREHLKRHIRSLHTNEKEYVCPQYGCGKTFNRRDNLAQHSRIHGTGLNSSPPQGSAEPDGSPDFASS